MNGSAKSRTALILAAIFLMSFALPLTSLADGPGIEANEGGSTMVGTGATGQTYDEMFGWMNKRTSNTSLNKIRQVVEGLGGAVIALLKTVLGVLCMIGFFWALIKIAIMGGQEREKGKSSIGYIVLVIIGAAGSTWFVQQIVNAAGSIM